jgi:transposase
VSYQHLPYERAAEILSDWVKAPISVGTLQAFITQGAGGLDGFLEEIRGQLADAQVAHFDETGGRVDGKLHWIHSASTDLLTLLSVHRKRGVEAMDAAGVLPDFTGVAVHDGWAPYRNYENSLHALCGAHHLRELTAAQEAGQMWALAMICLLLDTKALVEQAKAGGLKRLTNKALGRLHASYREVIAMGYEENPDLAADTSGRRPKRTKAQNLLLRLDERETDALRFASDFRVPFEKDVTSYCTSWGCWDGFSGSEPRAAVWGESGVVCCGRLVESFVLVVGAVAGEQTGGAPGLDCAGADAELVGGLVDREQAAGAESVAVAG